MSTGDPTSLSLTEAAAAIAARKLSAVEATAACLARIDKLQPKLNAFIKIEAEEALAAAKDADAALARGENRGSLHGVPLAHKDMFYRAGRISSCGSKIRRDVVAATTSTARARLVAAGAIDLGNLHMTEFAYGPTGHNYHFGHCRNPWNTDHMTGGSSSGSGVATAARLVHGALGSDTGGSVRLPATCCGVIGMKPTYGRVSRFGAMPLSFTLDTIGPLTRTVADNALMMRVVAGADPADPTASAEPVPDYVAALGRPIKGLKLGVPTNYFYDRLHADVAAAMTASLDLFRSLGAEIVEVTLPEFEAVNAACGTIMFGEVASLHGHWLRTRPQDYSDQLRSRLEPSLAIGAGDYLDALRYRGPALSAFGETVFSKVDMLHAPVLTMPVPSIAEADVGGSAEMLKLFGLITRLTRPFNFLGLPALSVPAGFTPNGLPVGFQLVGRPFAEAQLYAAGHAYEQAAGWHERAPMLG